MDASDVLSIDSSSYVSSVSVSVLELSPRFGSVVVVVTVPVLSIDEPVKDASTRTVNVFDIIAPLIIAPMVQTTVPVGPSAHPVGSAPVTVSPDASASVAVTPAASDGPLLVTFSGMGLV